MLASWRGYQFGGGLSNTYSGFAVGVAALPAYTATALKGPLLYNGTSGASSVTAYVVAVSYGITTASTVAGSIGVVVGQTTAPTSTSAITLGANLAPLRAAPRCSIFSAGTVSVAATAYVPTGRVHTGALTVDTDDDNFVHLGGLLEVGPGCFACVAAGAALTTSVIDIALVWVEVQND